jgi:hypothetical protein
MLAALDSKLEPKLRQDAASVLNELEAVSSAAALRC